MDPRSLIANNEDPRTVLAVFANPSDPIDVQATFSFSCRFLEQIGYPGNVLAVHTKSNYGRYRVATPRALSSAQSPSVTGFALAYVPPPETDAVRFGLLECQTKSPDFIISGRTALFPPKDEMVIPLVAQLAKHFPIKYGFKYVIDAAYGPAFHAVGVGYSVMGRKDIPPLPCSERERGSRWFNNMKDALSSARLRDVFPLNVLSDAHRPHRVQGMPLFDWISHDRDRGTLAAIAPGLWAWQVPDDRCVELGDELGAAGLFPSES